MAGELQVCSGMSRQESHRRTGSNVVEEREGLQGRELYDAGAAGWLIGVAEGGGCDW